MGVSAVGRLRPINAEKWEVSPRTANEGEQVGGVSSGITQSEEGKTNASRQSAGGSSSRKMIQFSAEARLSHPPPLPSYIPHSVLSFPRLK